MRTIKSVKQCFEDGGIIVTAIHQGTNGMVRVDAKARNGVTFFSEWVSVKYANKLAMQHYGKKVNELNSFIY